MRKVRRLREWIASAAKQQLIISHLTVTGVLDVNEKRDLPTRQGRPPLGGEA
jgi:hypothetical protein